MNRAAGFRVWDPYNKHMGYLWEGEGRLEFSCGGWCYKYIDHNTGDLIAVTEKVGVLMQFTGLHDKVRLNIWEGDIVKDGEFIYKIIWMDDLAAFGKKRLDEDDKSRNALYLVGPTFNKIKVIGDIYENPELIGEGE
jgi:uncharacterized phage protein (TIGR01671 family)